MGRDVFLGVMSGTSLDGLDMAACTFAGENFEILAANTFQYPTALAEHLKASPNLKAGELAKIDAELGHFIGTHARQFLTNHSLYKDTVAIASHGHTVLHRPSEGFTLQIGDGATIAATSGLMTITNFRNNDVAHGGQGAPLVPIGDLHLFPDYRFCLNLGGIANISCKTHDNQITGFDISGCNLLLNAIARKRDLACDQDGQLAARGTPNKQLLTELLSYHLTPHNRHSLDASEALDAYFKVAKMYDLSIEDQLATATTFIATLIGATIEACIHDYSLDQSNCKVLLTGGGAHNSFLVGQIKRLAPVKVAVPDPLIVDFKEALIFAFMGQLRLDQQPNCLASVTGARKDTIGGVCHLP